MAFRDRWDDDAAHPAGATAITVVTYDHETGQILDADVELNLRSALNPGGYVFDAAGDPASVDLQTVLTHELGHVQGLAHSADRAAVMWFAAGRTFARRALTPDDVAAICAVAPPAPAVACEPAASGAPRPVLPPEQGCATAPSPRRAGGAAMFALGLLGRRRRPGRASSRRPR